VIGWDERLRVSRRICQRNCSSSRLRPVPWRVKSAREQPLSGAAAFDPLLIPGFMAGDSSLKVMRGWLERIGYEAHASGIAFNVDCSDRTLDALAGRAETLAEQTGRRVALLGHSRGGHFVKRSRAAGPS